MRIPAQPRPRPRTAARVVVALAAATLAVAFGAPASAADPAAPAAPNAPAAPAAPAETSPSPSNSASPPAPEPIEKATEQDQFEEEGSARIDGIVWDDKNRNGIRDTDESPLADATVLIEPIDDGEMSEKTKLDALAMTRGAQPGLLVRNDGFQGVRTAADGRYEFGALPAVTVRLWVIGPRAAGVVGWRVSARGKGTDRKRDCDFAEATVDLPGLPGGGPLHLGKSDRLELRPGQNLSLDAGMFLKKHAGSISGLVWNDRNRNGVQDAGEKGVKGLPVVAVAERASKLSNSSTSGFARLTVDPAFHMTTTDSKGEYAFSEVVPGRWMVAVGAGPLSPDGRDIPTVVWTFTKKDAGGDDTKDSDVLLSARLQNKAALSDALTVGRDEKADVDAGVFRDEPSTNPSPSTEPSTSASPPDKPAPGTAGGSLPKTGFAIGGFLLAGLLLIGGGTALTLAARRRRHA